jgi:hypothetical protein
MHLCVFSLLPAGITEDGLKLIECLCCSTHTHTTYLPSLCERLCQSSYILSMFILGSLVPIRQLSHLPVSARTCTFVWKRFLSFFTLNSHGVTGVEITFLRFFEKRAIYRAYPLAELKTTSFGVKKYGFIVILIKRIFCTQLERGLDGLIMEEYIMVLAQNRTLVFGATMNSYFIHWIILVSLSLRRCLIRYKRLNNFEYYCTV